jgi:hypothetical protein
VIVAVGPRASAASGPSRDALGGSTSIAVPRAIIAPSFVALLAVFGLLFANMAIKAARVTVIVSSDGLLAWNLRGRRTRRASRSEIASIDLRPRTVARSGATRIEAYVTLTSGKGFWLDAVSATKDGSEDWEAQTELVRELISALGLGDRRA